MGLISKLFQTKSAIKEYILEHNLSEAIRKYGIETLCKHNFLEQYKNTELYHDFSYWDQRVYNKEGKFLGNTMYFDNSFNKQKVANFGTFPNGNIILSLYNEEKDDRFYGVFDKLGNKLVCFKYNDKLVLPNKIALIGYDNDKQCPVLTIDFHGEIEEQEYVNILEVFYAAAANNNLRCFKLYYPNGTSIRRELVLLDESGNRIEFNNENENGLV